ncbi:MAG: DUF4214 domain-containing protein [Acidimicrobiales bacterium]|nr:DUF4214 domain-containing protein [Acidimicrobiales bacterium]
MSVPVRVILLAIALVLFGAPPVSAATVPGPVRKLEAEVKSDKIEVSWEKPADDGDRRIREYEVYVAGPGFRTTRTDVDVKLPAPGTYTARVRARNSQGWGPWAETSPFTIRAVGKPSVPTDVKLTVRNGDDLRLTYSPPKDDGGSSIEDFRVRLNGPGYNNKVWTVGDDRTVDIKNVADGVYRAEVAAENEYGWGAWAGSNEVRVGNSPPGAVTSISAWVQDGTIMVSWSPPATDGGSAVFGYVVRVAPGFERYVSETTTALSGFNPGTFQIVVTARNHQGEGPPTTVGATIDAPPGVQIGPFISRESFVARQYLDLFDRPADASGLTFWTAQLAEDGSNASQVLAAMMASREFAPNYQAIRLYLAYFNRLPDNRGLNYWVDVLKQQGAPLAAVSGAFASSAEFRQTYGPLTDPEFVALVYNNVLLRLPDAAGYNYWVQQMRLGLGRGSLMTLFSDSAEFQRASNPAVQTVAIYNSMLDRSPQSEEFQRWVAAIGADPARRAQLVDQIFHSDEYRTRVR